MALLVAVQCAQHTVVSSFERTADQLAGKAALQVVRVGGLGVPEDSLDAVRRVPGCVATPIVQGMITAADAPGSPLVLLGIDFDSDTLFRMFSVPQGTVDVNPVVIAIAGSRAVFLTRPFAERHGFAVGNQLWFDTPRGRAELVVGGLLRDEGPARVFGGNFALMGIHGAQEILAKPARFDRIEVAPDGIGADELRSRLRAALDTSLAVEPIARRSAIVEESLQRLRSLVAISAIALVVGLFLIYNSVALSVTERTKDIGILRALGARRGQILGTLLVEWALIGFVGSALGVFLGYFLARVLAEFTAKTVNLYMLAVDLRAMDLSWQDGLLGLAAGTLTSTLAALVPALAAARVEPVELFRGVEFRGRATPRHRVAFFVGFGFVVISLVVVGVFGPWIPALGCLALATLAYVALALCAPQGRSGSRRRCARSGGASSGSRGARHRQHRQVSAAHLARHARLRRRDRGDGLGRLHGPLVPARERALDG